MVLKLELPSPRLRYVTPAHGVRNRRLGIARGTRVATTGGAVPGATPCRYRAPIVSIRPPPQTAISGSAVPVYRYLISIPTHVQGHNSIIVLLVRIQPFKVGNKQFSRDRHAAHAPPT